MKTPAYKQAIGDRVGSWTQTARGNRFFPLDPRPEDFIGAQEEIAEQLAKKPRFSGATLGQFYSNAEHCVLVSERAAQLAPRSIRIACSMEALFHDATDAYLADVARPIKYEVPAMFDGWRPVEKNVLAAIYRAYRIYPTEQSHEIIERADREVLAKECMTLLVHPEWSMMPGYEPAPQIVRALEWREAMALWLARFDKLWHAI